MVKECRPLGASHQPREGLKAYLAVVDADYQTQVKAHRSVLIKENKQEGTTVSPIGISG